MFDRIYYVRDFWWVNCNRNAK